MKLKSLTLSSVLLFFIFGCKQDSFEMPQNETAVQYFEDYQSPVNKWGYIDLRGNVKIKPIYDAVRDFNENRATVNYKGRWGIIDKDGNNIVDFQYKQITEGGNKIYLAEDFTAQWHILNLNSSDKQPSNYNDLSACLGQYCIVAKNGFWGLMNTDGSSVIPCQFDWLEFADENYLIAQRRGKWGIVDNSGKTVFDYSLSAIYKDGNSRFLRVKNEKGMMAFFDIISLKYASEWFDDIEAFDAGRALVRSGHQYILIDNSINTLHRFKKDSLRYLKCNLYTFKEAGKFGLINESGVILRKAKYAQINQCSDSKIAFKENGRYGYFNDEGTTAINPSYILAWDFKNGLASVIQDRGVIFIDSSGEKAVPGRYIEVGDFYQGLARYQSF